jgi:transposase
MNHLQKEEKTMREVTTVALDLAKSVFHAVLFDDRGMEVGKKKLRRAQVATYFAQLRTCVIAMEACASAQHWGRVFQGQGHEVRLVAAQHVKAFLQGNKHDFNDARAIMAAQGRSGMRFAVVKSIEQQDRQALTRLRQGCVDDRTALVNRLRGLLGEYGIVVGKGPTALRRAIPELLEDGDNGLSGEFRRLLALEFDRWSDLEARYDAYDRELKARARADEGCHRLQEAPGFGPVVAWVFASMVGDGRAYRRGRDVSAALGMVPRQYSTGGKAVLGRISKRGDRYLRSLLVHGARAVVSRAKDKDDALSRWINAVRARAGFNKAVVALANKMARMGWALLRYGSEYRPA